MLSSNMFLMNMKKFLIVDDHSSCAIWDTFLYDVAKTLKSCPKQKGFEKWCLPSTPQGEWTVANAMNAMMPPDSAYTNFGVRVPKFEEMPCIFVVNPDGSVEEQVKITAEQAGAFINARI